jgi:hypothetical protein
MTTVIARGSAIRQDAVNKAKSFDEKHQLRANATAKINSFDRRVGLSEKLNTGISVVNEKVKTVDQRLHVSDKTMAALLAAERKLNDTGSAVKTNRYLFFYMLLLFLNSFICMCVLYQLVSQFVQGQPCF